MGHTVLLCVTGCIAAYKSCEVVRGLQKAGMRVKVCMTEHATSFVGPTTFRALTHEEVAVDLFDNPSDPIHHVSLAQEPDLVLVAPATANVIAKLAHGLADDLLTTTLLATPAPILVAPAMNVGMWKARATQDNIELLKSRGIGIIPPATGYLACGDVGEGKLADVDVIVESALSALMRKGALEGERVLITAGGTREAIDPVRYIGNRSTGKMGHALAAAACAMGAQVTLVTSSTSCPVPQGVEAIRVESAQQMFEAVSANFDDCTMLVCAAAVADYTPIQVAPEKLSKADGLLTSIELTPTTDILATMSSIKGDRVVVGFAAETNGLGERAQAKLARKGCDAIVANDVSCEHSTFGSDTDEVLWITADGIEHLPCKTKSALSFDLLIRAVALKSKKV